MQRETYHDVENLGPVVDMISESDEDFNRSCSLESAAARREKNGDAPRAV